MSQTFNPNWYSHTGNTIIDMLQIKSVSFDEFCLNTSNDSKYWNRFIEGAESLTDTAVQDLSNYFETSLQFWWNRENEYLKSKEVIEQTKKSQWLKSLPLIDLKKRNWLEPNENSYQSCLDFFQVDSVSEWHTKYDNIFRESYFRKSESFELDMASFITWYRRGQIISKKVKKSKWNKERLENSLDQIKQLSLKKRPINFIPDLVELLAKCGISLAIEFTPAKCPVSGFTKFVNKNEVMMLLSFRHLSDDHFWFTIFHEIGHLILHDEKQVFSSPVRDKIYNEIEEEANLFAQEALLPSTLNEEVDKLNLEKRSIVRFALSNGISPGILIGQLQHRKRINFSYLNGYKRRYSKSEIKEACYQVYGI